MVKQHETLRAFHYILEVDMVAVRLSLALLKRLIFRILN